ncbi:PepSY domain-containing protein [Dyella nitratireducens]|uniref:PepSY domain-containing protein n=1 Tax=Dyella nitratireducens TaxID=1849580 RepID=A0ABQ1FV53_9GAMM|nr:PepSY domain-containing protein [Dyella nitratireducens]GGA31690.1 hypothetical protein GCM10010981_21020 [Dyella nitratireducens]GLQ42835.1 hypothetical protein GCM10007902_26850 [Dyella nitratireducens]
MKQIISMIVAVCVSGLPAFSTATPTDLGAQARIQMPEARAIALKAFPGRIVKEELEQEKGGSGLRYSFDITQGKVTHEVGVDAKTGKVLENSSEAADND